MGPETNQADIERLKDEIEKAVARKMYTPRDFEFLRECIFARIHTYLSVSTLKRLWNYMPQSTPRVHTLSILSQFLGFSSWDKFLNGEKTSGSSDYIMGRHIQTARQLMLNEQVRLKWVPDRVCVVRYTGNETFTVVSSVNTRLLPGDTFRCALIVEGEPLFLDDLRQGDNPPAGYVCGKISGISFEILAQPPLS